MAKLVRKTQKIFASGSAQNQVTSFGSIKAGAVDYTKDVADIQTEAFEGGWSSAVQDDYAPYRQDRNAVDFVTTSQLAYVFQEGLPEYDAGTTYYRGSWVKGNDGDAFSIYESLSDDNIGNALSDEEKWERKSFGGGLEIGDVGFAPLGIDEAQNKRRYLNGQVISQAQFVSFTNKLKSIIQTYPSLAVSETNWQATVTNSKLGQCGKFVIDDNAGTIRLPKVVNINGLQDLALMGSIKAESLPQHTHTRGTMNITGSMGTTSSYGTGFVKGAFYNASGASIDSAAAGNKNKPRIDFDASRNWTGATSKASGSTYQDNAPVQQEAIQYPYFIQVATGVEESVDITREIELNNPFFFGMSQYFESEPNNASWLISNGSFHSGATYVSFYEWLLRIYNGTETVEGVSVKANTDSYNKYDYVINTADQTFRLPLLNGSEEASGDVFEAWDISASGQTFTAPVNGRVSFVVTATASGQHAEVNASNGNVALSRATASGQTVCASAFAKKGSTIRVYYHTSSTIQWLRFYYSVGNGLLYYYVGETIQDANVIAASQVLTTVADSVRKSSATDRATVVGWGMPDYSAGVSLNYTTTNTNFPSSGIAYFGYKGASNTSANIYINDISFGMGGSSAGNINTQTPYVVSKNDVYRYQTQSNGQYGVFYPFKGVN